MQAPGACRAHECCHATPIFCLPPIPPPILLLPLFCHLCLIQCLLGMAWPQCGEGTSSRDPLPAHPCLAGSLLRGTAPPALTECLRGTAGLPKNLLLLQIHPSAQPTLPGIVQDRAGNFPSRSSRHTFSAHPCLARLPLKEPPPPVLSIFGPPEPC